MGLYKLKEEYGFCVLLDEINLVLWNASKKKVIMDDPIACMAIFLRSIRGTKTKLPCVCPSCDSPCCGVFLHVWVFEEFNISKLVECWVQWSNSFKFKESF